jgi:Raf kinase inhibitor-like YbhB/YbcL family protein
METVVSINTGLRKAVSYGIGGLLMLGVASQVSALTLTSPAFINNGVIPNTFAFNQSGCTGSNESPPLIFGDIPEGTLSFALVVRDLDAASFLHWRMWNIPVTVDVLPQNFSVSTTWYQGTNGYGQPSGLSASQVQAVSPFAQGVNGYGIYGYSGPCPAAGGSHRYQFTLYALNTASFWAGAETTEWVGGEPTDATFLASAIQTTTLTGLRLSTSDTAWMPSAIPQSGWWWNSRESGRGYSLERSATSGNVFLAAYMYTPEWSPTWYSAGLPATSTSAYYGLLQQYSNGQSLYGAHSTPSSTAYGNAVVLEPVSNTRALLTVAGDDANPGQVVGVSRFEFAPGSLSASVSATAPQTGWWWSTLEPGRGYFIEVQRNIAFVAAYMYTDSGTPVWYTTYNAMASGSTFSGNLQMYANGQAMGEGYTSPALVSANIGAIQLQFSSPTSGTITLPNGTVPISRFAF